MPSLARIISFLLLTQMALVAPVARAKEARQPIKASALEGRRVQQAYRKSQARQASFEQAIGLVCRYRQAIASAASIENISQRHIVGCLLSEHTYLSDFYDQLADMAAYWGLNSNASIGLVQMKLSTGRRIAKEIYKKQSVSDEKIVNDLLTPEIAVRYMAHLISIIISDYAHFGFDISNSTGLVCSSYLVGNSWQKAKTHKSKNTWPQMNYYGRFAHNNGLAISRIITGESCNN